MSDLINSTRYWTDGAGPCGAALWHLVEVDALAVNDDWWAWNDTHTLLSFNSDSINLKGLFLRVLADVRGCPLPRGVFWVDDSDWHVLEVRRRKDDCPVWAMVRGTPR